MILPKDSTGPPKNGAGLKSETPVLRPIDIGAGNITGKKIRGELDPVEVPLNAIGQALDRLGFSQAGRALDEQMTVGQEGDQQPLDQPGLADDSSLQPGF